MLIFEESAMAKIEILKFGYSFFYEVGNMMGGEGLREFGKADWPSMQQINYSKLWDN